MSDLAATNCGCNGCNEGNGCGCNSIIWIIILLFCCCGNNTMSFGNNGCSDNNNSCLIIILLLLCCGGCNGSSIFSYTSFGSGPIWSASCCLYPDGLVSGLRFFRSPSVFQAHHTDCLPCDFLCSFHQFHIHCYHL